MIILWGEMSKSTWGEQPVEDILKFTRIFMYLCMYLFIYLCVSRLLTKRKTIQTWNSAHILPLTSSQNEFFVFIDQIIVTAASHEKLPCHVDFPHISSIALLWNIYNLTNILPQEFILIFLNVGFVEMLWNIHHLSKISPHGFYHVIILLGWNL